MNNPFQEQLLKAGLVTRQQVHKAQKDKNKKNKQQRSKKQKTPSDVELKAQQAAKDKARQDRELNRKKEEAAHKKAISLEINQLIQSNRIDRGEDCEVVYNFEHNNKINRIYVNDEMKQKIVKGQLGIARIQGRYELVPKAIAEKIRERNEQRIILFDNEETDVNEDDGYADFQIPDDLTW